MMRSNLAYFALIVTLVTITSAQDSKFPPAEQQIPVPECLTMRGLWEGGSKACTQNEHEAWLADVVMIVLEAGSLQPAGRRPYFAFNTVFAAPMLSYLSYARTTTTCSPAVSFVESSVTLKS